MQPLEYLLHYYCGTIIGVRKFVIDIGHPCVVLHLMWEVWVNEVVIVEMLAGQSVVTVFSDNVGYAFGSTMFPQSAVVTNPSTEFIIVFGVLAEVISCRFVQSVEPMHNALF